MEPESGVGRHQEATKGGLKLSALLLLLLLLVATNEMT